MMKHLFAQKKKKKKKNEPASAVRTKMTRLTLGHLTFPRCAHVPKWPNREHQQSRALIKKSEKNNTELTEKAGAVCTKMRKYETMNLGRSAHRHILFMVKMTYSAKDRD